MRTEISNESGFSLLETGIALGLVALGTMASLSLSTYISRSTASLNAKAESTAVKNLVQIALNQKKFAPGLPPVNLCVSNLVPASLTTLKIPLSGGVPVPTVLPTNKVDLTIQMGTTNVITSGVKRTGDQNTYDVRLVGQYKSTVNGRLIYVGAVEIDTVPTATSGVPITTSVPLEFEVDGTGQLKDCYAKPLERELAGSRNSVSACQLAAGRLVATSVGTLCRFSFLQPLPPAPTCPDGFVGNPLDPLNPCVVDPNLNTTNAISVIPACPSPSVQETALGAGNAYCVTNGVLPPPLPSPLPTHTDAPPCPTDPDWVPLDHPVGMSPTPTWTETSYDQASNYRHCKYNGTCDPPAAYPSVVPISQGGDGITPACYLVVPTSCPTPFVRITNPILPLKCFLTNWNINTITPSCPLGFTNATGSVTLDWNDAHHVVCY